MTRQQDAGSIVCTEFDPTLPQGMGDVTHLQQVIMNLMMNAMDATEGIQNRSPDVRILARRSGANEVLVITRFWHRTRSGKHGDGIPTIFHYEG